MKHEKLTKISVLTLSIIGIIGLSIGISKLTSSKSDISSSIAESPLFPYVVGIIVIFLIGLGYLILEKFHLQKLK